MAVDTEEGFLETNFKVCLIHVKVVIKSFSMFADVAINPPVTINSQCGYKRLFLFQNHTYLVVPMRNPSTHILYTKMLTY